MQPGIALARRHRLTDRLADALSHAAEAERGRFALWLPVCMTAGAVLYFTLPMEPPAWAGAGGVLLFLLLGWPAPPVPRAACWAIAALALGLAAAQLATLRAPPLADIPTHATSVTGTIRAVEQLPQGRRLILDHPSLDAADPLPRAVRIRLRPTDTQPLGAGDTLRLRALLRAPAPPAYPGGWDLQRDAFYTGIAAYGYALGPAERLAPGVAGWLQPLRETIAARIAAALPDTEGAIAATLLAGAATSIPEPDRAAFRDSGLAHLLAIAGLHIGIVMALVFAATRLALASWEHAALRWPTKTIAVLASLAAGLFYLLLTGAHVPILRSFAMACLVALGVAVGRRALSLRGLVLAMAALVLAAPQEVTGPSFQMSFSAVLALIAGYAALRPALARLYGDGSWRHRLRSHVVALALTSALAGTASAPFAAYHFGRIAIYYVLANIVAVPITALWVMPAGLLALALMPLHLEALALVPMGWGIDAVLRVAHTVSSWPAAVLLVPPPPDWGLAVLSLGLAWLGLWRSRLRLAGIAAIVLGLASPALSRAPDVLVSADARLIALHTDAGVFVQQNPGASRFTLDSWFQLWAVAAATPLPVTATPGLACDPAGCTLRHGSTARLLRGEGDCAAAVVISAEPIRRDCPDGIVKIDRFSVWHDGAFAVWLNQGGATVLSDRENQGARPWVPPDPEHRVPPGLTPALAE